jgi:hypothetical protein
MRAFVHAAAFPAADRVVVFAGHKGLNLSLTYYGRTAEQWARDRGFHCLADTIAEAAER